MSMPGKNVPGGPVGLLQALAGRENFQVIDNKKKETRTARIQTSCEAHLMGESRQFCLP
jgi:hypothetical protein